VSISTFKLTAGLVRRGERDVWAVLPGEGELTKRLRDASVNVRIIPFHRFRRRPADFFRFLFGYFSSGFKFYRFIRKNRIDIVHFSDLVDAPFYPWARLGGAKVITHARVCVGRPIVRSIVKNWTSFFCSRIIAITEFTKSYYGFDKNVSVVYNPGPDRVLFDPDKIDGSQAAEIINSESDSRPVVITVATFRRDKGHHYFLETASALCKKFSNNIRFVIIGGKVDGHEDYYNEVMEAVEQKGLGSCLTVTGTLPHEEVPAIMAGGSVFLFLPQWEEALGGVILEAMALGVSVVAFDRGGIRECFEDGVSGFLVPYGDINGAVTAAARLIESQDLRQQTVPKAREFLNSRFTYDKHLDNVEKIYDELLADN